MNSKQNELYNFIIKKEVYKSNKIKTNRSIDNYLVLLNTDLINS